MPRAMDHRQAVETLALERYLLGEMADQERDAFEEHFFSCAECTEEARAGGALRDFRRRVCRSDQGARRRRASSDGPGGGARRLTLYIR